MIDLNDYDFDNFMEELESVLDSDENFTSSEPPPKKFCLHKWKEIRMITSIVYDCEKCGIKKEDM